MFLFWILTRRDQPVHFRIVLGKFGFGLDVKCHWGFKMCIGGFPGSPVDRTFTAGFDP